MAVPPVLFPLWPRPGCVETLEWLTYVQLSEDGSEERTEMRVAPRQSFQYSFFVPHDRQARISNVIYGGRTLQWRVPVWPQVQHLGAVAAGLGILPAETRYSEFRAGGEVLLWQSPEIYQVLALDAVLNDGELDLGGVTLAFDDAYLTPLRRGFLTSAPSRSFDGRQSSLDLTFQIEDNAELVPDAPAQYLGDDLYTDPGLLDGGRLTEQLQARFEVFDEGLGLVAYDAPWQHVRPARTHRMMGEDPAETWAIREFLHRRAGRSRAFWQPSFEVDLRLNDSGVKTNSIRVRPDDYAGFAPERAHLGIETDAGWLVRAVTSTLLLGPTQLQVNLSASLGGIDASTIRRVCYLGRKRLDTDRVDINWIGGRVAAVAVNTVEFEP